MALCAAVLSTLAPSAATALPVVFEPGAKPGPDGDPHAERRSEFRETIAPGRYIVVLDDSIRHPGDVAHQQVHKHDGNLGFVYHLGFRGYSVSHLSTAAVRALRDDPRVKYVTPDRKVKLMAQAVPSGVSRISATTNPGLDIDGLDDVRINADVAVIDTGIDSTHPDLNVVARTNCVPPTEAGVPVCVDNSGTDGDGHGTHVGGTVGALDNGEGVVGVAPGARLWAVRVLDDKGEGYSSWINAGVQWVTAHASEIEVANMSLGGNGWLPSQTEAVEASVNAGVVYSVAAGNYANNTETRHPANIPGVITVSALADWDGKAGAAGTPAKCTNWGPDDTLASFSNWGSSVEVAAPGVCINSTLPGNKYGTDSGTSMASPHVAGAAAYLASKSNPNSRGDVESIRRTLIDGGSLNWNDTSEDGKVEPVIYIGGEALADTEVATAGATTLDGKSAVLSGAINPRGRETTYQFEYGTTTSYGLKAPVAPKVVGAAAGYTKLTEQISGLVPGQVYHYRLVASNSSGTKYGRDQVLTASRWTVRSPSSGGVEEEWLNDVSCPTATWCMAVSHYYAEGANRTRSHRSAGEGWLTSDLASPGGYAPNAHGVSCTSSSNCIAVGKYSNGETVVPLAERWNGVNWEVLPIAPPSGAQYTWLNEISCLTATECIAVGYYKNASGIWVNFSTQWKNGIWTTLETPNAPTATESELDDISCVAGSCTAVGWYDTTSGNKPIVEVWNGTSWSIGVPARSKGTLGSVSCSSSTFCAATGGPGLVAESWNGTSWSTQPIPLPSGYNGGSLTDVSCVSASYCTAVGYYYKGERYLPLIYVWNGTAWVEEKASRDDESSDEFLGVSCVAFSACLAVGGATEKASQALIEERREVITDSVTNVNATGATLNGRINPGGLTTSYRFELGTTTGYGTLIPASPVSIGSGAESVSVSQPAQGLRSETTYHARVVSINAKGSSYGGDITFRTTSSPPVFSKSFGSTGSGNGQLKKPLGTAVDASGNVWVADAENNRIEKFNSNGEYIGQFGSLGTGNGQFKKPADIAITPSGDVWVADAENNRIQKFNSKGEFLMKFGVEGLGPGQFNEPLGIAVAPSGDLWISDSRYYRVQQFTAAGTFVREVHGAGNGGSGPAEFWHPTGIAVDAEGHIWVADSRNNRVQELSSTGVYMRQFGTFGTGNGQFNEPSAIDVKPSGNLLVTDEGNGRVQEFTPTGEFVAKFGSAGSSAGKFWYPAGIAWAPGGLVYVADTGNNRMQKWQW